MVEVLCPAGVWLCTYLMHSTLVLAGVGLLDRFRFVKSTNALETLWRVAIVGGLVTATFQFSGKHIHGLVAPEFFLGHWMVGDKDTQPKTETRSSFETTETENESESTDPFPEKNSNSTVVVHLPSKIVAGDSKNSLSGADLPDLTYAYAERFALRFTSVLALIWFVGAIMKTSCLVWHGLQARSELKGRTPVDSSRWSALRPIAESSELLSPTLSVSDNIDGPIALPNGEIIFPRWIIDSLKAEYLQAIYAHELAHQVRRDPIWLLLLHFLNAVLWIQPFHTLARRRLVHLAELQADAWAARKLSDARVLADSLYTCAERIIAPPQFSFGSSFSTRGALVERIDCLLDGTANAVPKRPYLTQLLAASSLVFALFFMPGCNVDTDMAYHSGEKVSVTKQGDGKKGEATIRRANQFVRLSHNGTLKLTADSDDIEALENGGRFTLAESQGNAKRVYTVTVDNLGVVKRSCTLNGRESPIDENVQAWFADALQRTVRESGF